jgi:DNA-binding transcriptional ArsR family regulator
MKKSFLLVSLKENKAKKLAEVISNKTCRKILDYLAEKKDATESDMAKDLKIPISTVHYNMKALLTARLVKCDEYHYSSKGKEVNHYRLANQYVIIAPEGEKALIREKLKSIIPTALIMGFAAGVIKLFSGAFGAAKTGGGQLAMKAAAPAMEAMDVDDAVYSVATDAANEVAEEAVYETAGAAADSAVAEGERWAADEAAQAVAKGAANGADVVVQQAPDAGPAVQHVAERLPEAAGYVGDPVSHAPEIALWFLIGAVAGVAVYLLVEYIVKRIRNR